MVDRAWYNPSVSPDKTKVAMNVGIGTYDLKDQAINIVDLQKGQIWPTKTDENDSKFIQNSPEIVKLPEGYQFPQKGFGGIITWSPDSRFIATALENKANFTSDILILDLNTKKWIKLTELQNATKPVWSRIF